MKSEKLIPDPFLKNKIEHISESVASAFRHFVFIACQVEVYRSLLKLSCRPLAFTSFKGTLMQI